jgi:hypothetical protein
MVRRIGEHLVNLGVVFLISTVHVSASADEPSDRKESASSTRESIMKEPVHLTGAQVSILTQAAASLAQLEEYFEVEAQVPQLLEHLEQAKVILESTLHEGKDVVLRTQENFQKLASSEGSKQASNAFFSDIIGRYRTQEEFSSNGKVAPEWTCFLRFGCKFDQSPPILVPLSGHLFFNIEPRVKTLGYDLLPLRGKANLRAGRFPLTPAPSMT